MRRHARRRLAALVTAWYLAAWAVGVAFGFGLSRTFSWAAGAEWEQQSLRWAHEHHLPSLLDRLMLAMPYFGTNLTMLPLILVVGLVLWRKYDQPLIAIQLLVISIGSLSLNPTMKYLLNRPRPAMYPPRGMWTWASYPSGHLILTTALYFSVSMLLLEARGWRWPFVVTAVMIALTAYSRVYLSVHWPTDLIGGLLIGVTWLVGTWTAFAAYGRTTHAADLPS